MNDLIAILPQPSVQTDVAGSTGKAGRNGGNSDFSSEFKRAGERRGDDSPRAKREESKPAEELAAYASAQQNTYRARQTEKSDDAADTVESVSEAVAPVAEQPEAPAVAPVVVDEAETFAQMLAELDPETAAMTGELDVTDFLAEMISETDEHLGDVARAVNHARDDAEASRSRRAERRGAQEPAVQAPAGIDADAIAEEPVSQGETPVVAETAAGQEPAAETVETPEYAAIAEKITESRRGEAGEGRENRRVRHGGHEAFLQRYRERMAADGLRHGHRPQVVEEPVNNVPSTEPVEEPPFWSAPVAGVPEIRDPVIEAPRVSEPAVTPPKTDKPARDTYTNPFAYMGIKDSQVMGYDPATRTMPIQVVNQIVEAIRLAVADGRTTMEIQLNPEALGKVSILLTHSQDGLTAQIRVPDDRVDNMLNVGLGDLTNSLKDLGINLKNIEITQSNLAWDFARGNLNGDNDQQQRGYQGGGRRGNHTHRGHHIEGLSGVLHHDLLRLASMLYGSQAGETSVEFNA